MSGHHRVYSEKIWIDSNNQTLNYYHSFDKVRSYPLSEFEIKEKKNRLDFIRGSYRIVFKGSENDILRMKIKLRFNGIELKNKKEKGI